MLDKFTYMHSKQLGAPQVGAHSNANGQLLQMLDACLINGWGSKVAASATVALNKITLSYGVAHGYLKKQIISVSGANQAAINGNHRIDSVTVDTITLTIDGVMDATGTITTKVAPLGFQSVFGSANPLKRAYRSANPLGTQTVLYLDMGYPASSGYAATNPATRAMVSLCEDMTTLGTQIGSYTNGVNNFASNPNGSLFWYQSRSTSKVAAVTLSENQSWVIVGNGDLFYLFIRWSGYSNASNLEAYRDFYAFGDVKGLDDADTIYNCIFMGSASANDLTTTSTYSSLGSAIGDGIATGSNTKSFFISDTTGLQELQGFSVIESFPSQKWESGFTKSTSLPPYPLKFGGLLLTIPLLLSVGIDGFRAKLPLVRAIPQNLAENKALDLTYIDTNLIVGMHNARTSSFSGLGFLAIDLEGLDYE